MDERNRLIATEVYEAIMASDEARVSELLQHEAECHACENQGVIPIKCPFPGVQCQARGARGR